MTTSGRIASIGVLCVIVVATASGSLLASCGGPWDVACHIGDTAKKGIEDTANTGKKSLDDAVDTGKKAVDDTLNTSEKAGKDVAKTATKALEDTANTAKKAVDDTVNTAKKTVDDAVWNYTKAANDILDAGKAAGRFVERQIRGVGDSLTDAQKRIREGKVVDAFWHAYTDRWKHTEENAALATHESDVINSAGQAAASFYGGPAGAAAYAAWYTYRSTGDANLALRAGILTGITSSGYANVNAFPTDTVGQVVKKSIVTGALGGAAVAASGGDDAAVRDAFLKSGGMVIVQSGQSYVTKKYVDPAIAKADSYCTSAVGTKCSMVLPKLQHDAAGKVLLDENGNPKFDTSAILPERQQIGDWKQLSDQAANDALRKVPGANAIFVSDNQWAISWDKGAFTSKTAKLPAVVVTYSGNESPLGEKIQELKALTQGEDASGSIRAQSPDEKKPVNLSPEETWVPLHDVGNPTLFFDRVLPNRTGSVSVGEILRANRDVGVTSGPPNWETKANALRRKTVVFVTDTRQQIDPRGRPQDWARVEVVGTSDTNAVEGASTDAIQLLTHLASLAPTFGPPLWKMLPNSLWYVYKGKIDGAKRCIDFDANWTDPIVSDFTHKMRAVGVGAQGFGAQVF